MKKLIAIVAVVLFTGQAFGQQDPHFTLYMFNKQMLNPAYVGSREATSITALYRSQWFGMEGRPKTFNIGIHSPIGQDPTFNRMALGGLIFNDKLGTQSHTGFYGQYAYRIPVSTASTLSLGIGGGITRFSADLTSLERPVWAYPGSDYVLREDIDGRWLPNLGVGVYLYADKYFIGAALPQLIDNKYRDETPADTGRIAQQYRHFFAMAGYVFDISDNLKLKPHVIAKYVGFENNLDTPFDFDVSLGLVIQDRVMLGLAYRFEDSFDALLELQITKNLRMGYAFDFLTLSDIHEVQHGSHEIMLGLDFGKRVNTFNSIRFPSYF